VRELDKESAREKKFKKNLKRERGDEEEVRRNHKSR
jgi:hypothetical protein